MQLCRLLLFFGFFPLYRPQRSHWGSSHRLVLSIDDRPICVCQNCPQAGREMEVYVAQLPFPRTFQGCVSRPHTCSRYWASESSLLITALQMKLREFHFHSNSSGIWGHVCRVRSLAINGDTGGLWMSTGVHVNTQQWDKDVTGDVRVLQTNKDVISGELIPQTGTRHCNHVWKKTKKTVCEGKSCKVGKERRQLCLGGGSCLQPGWHVWAASSNSLRGRLWGPNTRGEGRDEKAAEIYTLCCLRGSTTSRLFAEPLRCRVRHLRAITSHPKQWW